MSRARAWMLGVLAVALMAGCPAPDPDGDETCDTPRPLPPAATISDSVGVKRGDLSDCKVLEFHKEAVAHVEYLVGSAFKRRDIEGHITVYDRSAIVLQKQIVNPSGFEFKFDFTVEPGKRYFVDFRSTKGGGAYTVRVKYELVDPCKACTASQRCVQGQCVSLPPNCAPECEPDTEQCEDGRCVSVCGPCKNGYACDGRSRTCKPIGGKRCRHCPSGYKCNRAKTRCIPKRPCPKGCKPGEVCRRGACRPVVSCPSTCPPGERCSASTGYRCSPRSCPTCSPGEICGHSTDFKCVPAGQPVARTFRVVSVTAAGPQVDIYINVGRRDHVKVGMRGRLCGKHRFVVQTVERTRARIRANVGRVELGACRSGSFSR